MLPLSLLRTAAGHPMVRTRPAHSPARPRRARPAYSPARVRPAPSQLVELKNGETYNGELVSCDSWMNIRCARRETDGTRLRRAAQSWTAPCHAAAHARCAMLACGLFVRSLRGVICTSRDGDRFWRLPEVIIRGNNIKYLRIPEEVIAMVPEEDPAAKGGGFGGRGGGRGDGRGRGGKGDGKGGRGGGRGRGEGRGGGRAAGRGH